MVAASLLLLGCRTWATPVEDKVAFPAGFYTFENLAERFSTPALRLRAKREIASRAAFISMRGRPRAEALAIIEEAFGLDIESDSISGRATLLQNPRQKKNDRAWRGEVFERLRGDVDRLVQTTATARFSTGDEVNELLEKDRAAFLKSLGSLSSKDKELRLEAYVRSSSFQRAASLQSERSVCIYARNAVARALRNASAGVLTSDNRLAFVPVTEIGPDFVRVNTAYSGVTHCLIGWEAHLMYGRLTLEPVASLAYNHFLDVNARSEIGCGLPGEAEAGAGLDLADTLFGSPQTIGYVPVLDRSAQNWRRSLDGESRRILTSGDVPGLSDRALPYLSQRLAQWARETGKEVAIELSPAAERAGEGGTPFPAWRFRWVHGVLAPVDLMGFWRRGRSVPVAAFTRAFGMTTTEPEEAQLRAFYKGSGPGAYDWSDTLPPNRYVAGDLGRGAPAYYGVPFYEVEAGWPTFRCWQSLRTTLLPQVDAAPEGILSIPLSRVSPGVLQDAVSDFRALYPKMANFLEPAFWEELRGGSLIVRWKPGPEGKSVELSFSFPSSTIAEATSSGDYWSCVRFRIRP